jgi:sugar phosphate isomerase/epimerase
MSELSVNETTTYRWSFEEDVAEYAAAGIPAIGVWRQKLSDCGQSKAIELLQETGLKVSHLFWAGGFTGGDGRTYRESIEDAREALETAAALGTNILAVCSGPRAGHTHKHARRLIENALTELLPQAESLGMTLAIEPMHIGCSADWTFLTTVDDVLQLLNTLGNPRVKMVLDTYHVGQDPGLAERAAELVPHVAIIQLGDARHPPLGEQNRCLLGEGVVPISDIVMAMEAAGYNGFYDVELHGEEIETAEYHLLLQHARRTLAAILAKK